jgi:hypothetical protein
MTPPNCAVEAHYPVRGAVAETSPDLGNAVAN